MLIDEVKHTSFIPCDSDSHSVVSGLFPTPWILAYQALPSMGFSRQEYWNGLLFPSPGIKLGSPACQVDSLPVSYLGSLTLHFDYV